ncbi:hypothetical protein [Chryseobacterium sp. CT-SW4]|uniref:hypothetical protein n=1 Tax=Chryseobacterium sp. SW-1 TaxID=3157343 RepID=UPI003B02A72B
MEKIKKYYHYFYYKWYKLIEYTSRELGGAFLTDFKATIAMMALEIWIMISIYAYYSVITKQNLHLSLKNPLVYIPFSIIVLLKWRNFTNKNQWENYHKAFDELPKDVNKKGDWIVFGISVFIFFNFIFSIYLMMQVDWSKYR